MISKEYHKTIFSRVPDRNLDTFNTDLIECIKYLAIMSLTPGRRIVVTPEVDDVWHELIVQTRNYSEFCKWLPGGKFIHHTSITPLEYEGIVGKDEFVTEFLKWIPDYVNNFGPFTDEAAKRWTVVQFLLNTLGMTLADINNLGKANNAEIIIDKEWLNEFRTISSRIVDY